MKKIIALAICIGVIMIATGALLEYFYPNPKNNESKNSSKEKTNSFSLINTKKIEMCNRKIECGLEKSEFSTLQLDTSFKEVREKVESINENTQNYYKTANTSTMNALECSLAKEEYQKRLYVLTNYQLYEDEWIISIAVNRTIKDLCTDTYQTIPYDVFVYDKKKELVLHPNDLLSNMGYTEDMVNEDIINSINNINATEDYIISIDDVFINGQPNYSVFYNEEGFLVLAYQIKNSETFDYQEVILGN